MPPISRPTSTSGCEMSKPSRISPLLVGLHGQLLDERCEQHERGEHGGADRVALGDGLGRVADRVERVGDVADVLGQLGHLGDAAGVVGDRAERVERDDQAGQRQLRHHRDADAVDAAELVGDEDADRDHDRRCGGRLEALGEALDDVRGVTGLGRLRGAAHRAEAGRGVVVGDHEQQRGDADADQRAEPDVHAGRRAVEAAGQQVRASGMKLRSSISQSETGRNAAAARTPETIRPW